MNKALGFFFILFPLVFMGIGSWQAWEQHHAISSFTPVKTQILKTNIRENRSSKSTSYTPIVHYTYTFANQQYKSHKVMPIKISSSYKWASGIISNYKRGSYTTAYVNPNNPTDAFLYRKYSFFPYMFIMFPSLFIGIGMGLLSGAAATKQSDPVKEGNQYHLIANMSNQLKLKTAIQANIPLWIIWCLSVGHFFYVAQKPYPLLAVIVSSVYTVICLAAAMSIWYFRKISKTLEPAIVTISHHPLVLGQDFQLEYAQTTRENIFGQSITVELACWHHSIVRSGGKSRMRKDKIFEDKRQVKQMFSARIFDTIKTQENFTIPLTGTPSSQKTKGYPRYEWTLTLHVKIQSCPDYKSQYTLRVNPLN